MTLLDSIPNRKLGNALFQENVLKLCLFKTKDYNGAFKIPKLGTTQIDVRQKHMAKIACHIWRLDY
jgi:hypothetical protein